jgi:hypothetical protein
MNKRPCVACEDWTRVSLLINAARGQFQLGERRFKELLAASDEEFAPLSDPLTVDVGVHRWLSAEREEAYSDWLGWIIDQLDDREVFELFTLEPPGELAEGKRLRRKVEREFFVRTDNGRAGRLDVLIRFPGKALIVIELKKGSAEGAQTDKQTGYEQWLLRQPEARRDRILVVTSAEQESYHGFKPREWRQVCLQLRRIAARVSREPNLMDAVMILAFVGAVEQNLLGFSTWRSTAFIGGERVVLVDTRTIDYLAEWVTQGPHMTLNRHACTRLRRWLSRKFNLRGPQCDAAGAQASRPLLEEGAKSYCAARLALAAFEENVRESCRKVVKGRLEHDGDALGFSAPRKPPTDWSEFERKPRGELVAAVGIEITGIAVPPKVGARWRCGLWWEAGAERAFAIVVSIGFDSPKDVKMAEALRLALDDVQGARVDKEWVWLRHELLPEEVLSFPEKLDHALGCWIQALKRVGGLQGLASRVYP